MATRSETLGRGSWAPKAVWITLFAIVMIGAAVVLGTLVNSNGEGTKPARPATVQAVTPVELPASVPALVEGGLQPRPFTTIPVAQAVGQNTAPTIPDGFVRMPGGELRPTFGG